MKPKIINQAGQGYPIVIKKSKFIGSAAPVKSKDEALEFIDKIKKSNKKANHNAYAYRIDIDGKGGIILNADDDGEPQGTSGNSILYVLEKQNIINTVIVVTRYYGGIKLGKGGLVRAYSHTASDILKNIGTN